VASRRVSVFSVGGDFVRHVGIGVLISSVRVASSASLPLVVERHSPSLAPRQGCGDGAPVGSPAVRVAARPLPP
jgi:hypothetical protein